MYLLHGFIEIASMVNNSIDVDSPIGELSNVASTYSREIGKYSQPGYDNVELYIFNSKLDEVAVAVPTTHSNKLLEIAQWLFTQSVGGFLSDNKADCLTLLNTEFSSEITISDIGEMATNGTYYLPSHLYFTIDAEDDNVVKLWFSDPAFRVEYDLYEMIIVPPVDTLDDLHGTQTQVLALLNANGIQEYTDRVRVASGGDPYTKLMAVSYDWVSKTDTGVTKTTQWGVLIWGPAGNNSDLIRLTIIDYVLDNSQEEREEWELIYPDIFRPTEFYIAPIWDRYSLPEQMGLSGVYSSVFPLRLAPTYTVPAFQDTPQLHVDDHLVLTSTVYKGLLLLIVGNHRNRDDVFDFDLVWPEYVNLSTTNIDFNRIPPATGDFIIMLNQMLVVAESWTPETTLPNTVTLVIRSGVNYIAATYQNILYLVKVKAV